ncbi:MAG: hypothetical protein A3B90_01930 [Candidatus Magasanikbacteria bacterium RIFCSPHIGHO2_02_FULL_41_13]|uniref:Leucine-binding protein domain-containing protein n=1 Tax=Candidatus Magasanikbacteria bacterium RIFCSPHIGHO2_02_FULL_41_13 TaxID=1798676 RepID=A0A1F6M2A5_9BACT|nr:MAG: hypothetical protein A3B90_01930 [Candidatus Magasanikbacteria bacterium RIFCSPHIGHO2_02_FULL_41_13]
MNRKYLAILVLAIVVVGGVYLLKKDPGVVAPAHISEPIKIAWMGPLSGDVANLGKDALAASQLAVDELNVAGGVKGRKIELVVEDGKCNPKDASAAANKLINIDKVSSVIVTCSPEVNVIAPIANANKVAVLSSCASAPNITDAGDYIFRTYPSDSFQGVYVADYVYNKLGKRKVAILAAQNDWALGIEKAFKQDFENLGGQVVVVEEFSQEVRDLRSQITKIKNSEAELIYFPAFTEATLLGLKQIKELGVTVPVIGGDTWDDQKVLESDFAQGVLYTTVRPNYNFEWKAKMDAKGINTTLCTPPSYDNVKILADIIGRVGDDGEKIKNELYKVKDYAGVNGNITLDQNGDLTSAVYDMKKIENKKAVILK